MHALSVCWVWPQSWISPCVKTITTLDKIPQNLQYAQCKYQYYIKFFIGLKHHDHIRHKTASIKMEFYKFVSCKTWEDLKVLRTAAHGNLNHRTITSGHLVGKRHVLVLLDATTVIYVSI